MKGRLSLILEKISNDILNIHHFVSITKYCIEKKISIPSPLWHIRSPLLKLIFVSVAFSPRPWLGIGMHFLNSRHFLSLFQYVFVFETFDCMGWIRKVSCIPGHLAFEVFAELRNSSVSGIWGWKQTGIVCLGHLISHNCQRGAFRPTSTGLHHLSLVLSVSVVNTSS